MGRPMNAARESAKLLGARFYQGKPCARGHAGERYTSTRACRQCLEDQPRPDRAKAKESK